MKKMKKSVNKIFSLCMVAGLLFQILIPIIVSAQNFVDNVGTITIGGTPTIEDNVFNYDNGSVTITKTASAPEGGQSSSPVTITTTSFTVAQGDVIKFVFSPIEGYNAQLFNATENHNVNITNNEYEFEVHSTGNGTIAFTPSFHNNDEEELGPPISDLKFSFKFNGTLFENVSVGDDILVSNNFNLDTVEEFYVTEIVDGNRRTYTYGTNEYSKQMIGRNGLPVFAINKHKYSDNYLKLRVESHTYLYPEDGEPTVNILQADLDRYGKTIEDYFGFYITGLNFIKEDFKGVEVSTEVMPDNYDFTIWNGADLGSTTVNNPGTVSAYYGEDTINFNSETASPIKKIELVEGKGVPSSAVEINNENGTIKILSNYYNQILVKIELEDGTIGYININRIGIFIGDIPSGSKQFYHGAFADVGNNLNVETNKNRIVAVFYHEDTTTYEDYDLIANITYANGTTETKFATGVGDVDNSGGNIVGSDYILWSGDLMDTVEKVSVTAVKKGALTDETTFGGATFGSGAGVEWEGRRHE